MTKINKYAAVEAKILEAMRLGVKEHLHTYGTIWSAAAEVSGREDNPYVWGVVKLQLQKLREGGYIKHDRGTGWSLTDEGRVYLDKLDGKIERTVHVLRCGAEDWTPTGEELQKLVEVFMTGGKDPMGAVLAVDSRVQHSTLHVSKGDEFVALDGYMTDTEIEECAQAFALDLIDPSKPGGTASAVAAFRAKLKQMRGQ